MNWQDKLKFGDGTGTSPSLTFRMDNGYLVAEMEDYDNYTDIVIWRKQADELITWLTMNLLLVRNHDNSPN